MVSCGMSFADILSTCSVRYCWAVRRVIEGFMYPSYLSPADRCVLESPVSLADMYRHSGIASFFLWSSWASHLLFLTADLMLMGGFAIILALLFVNFCLEPLEAEFWWHGRLTPRFYLCLQVLKAVLWTGLTPVGVLIILRANIQPKLFAGGIKPVLYAAVASTAFSYYASLVCAVVIWLGRHGSRGSVVSHEEEAKRQSLKQLISGNTYG
ncbi:hypothetical protein CLAFUW4_04528 [Fulvia fulva]|uniref:Uncharacterized protein n=1 Tax=Passalora fulva TaxID=5499 RepID=A0A9Q8P7A1_PASFU|nr:uncharacterized protein CLAFUR5_04491 [Fulvia fulva]KAK4627034.1 hypothetical protein CLAFUR4_04514 [Fulvia fulva]KAK4627752.1 hypothetical protein CLAFUR0_04517 [Fulvia fulva]UJO15796.1 hypothetical protein CLAFUR5_04491 [Fulvia fulva]WPV13286.1 hypothetical protein CLAFUW4_04528 [Fulvia fulva]WPV28712.1 hypothetical protein CLAFUW7_04520 [Fulvia fulva]